MKKIKNTNNTDFKAPKDKKNILLFSCSIKLFKIIFSLLELFNKNHKLTNT